jgi:hypothetical protein
MNLECFTEEPLWKRSLRFLIERKAVIVWHVLGQHGVPPPRIKQRIVANCARENGIKVLVETGTYLGEMIKANLKNFSSIHSVELGDLLFGAARSKFAKYSHVSLYHGDSAEVMPFILRPLSQPALFWLDAHYSGGITAKGKIDTPILEELRVILSHNIKGHVILIDDARCFDGKNGYPSLEELSGLLRAFPPSRQLSVKHDIIRIAELQHHLW